MLGLYIQFHGETIRSGGLIVHVLLVRMGGRHNTSKIQINSSEWHCVVYTQAEDTIFLCLSYRLRKINHVIIV